MIINKLGKSAFTLAEVLVTIGVLGVVAAMTIPTLMNSYQKQVYVTTLHKSYNVISQAITDYMTDKNAGNLIEAGLTSQDAVDTWVASYFKYITKSSTQSDCFAASYDRLKTSGSPAFAARSNYYVLSDGVAFAPLYSSEGNKIMNIAVDVNGQKGPNILGRDFFFLAVYKNGLIDDYNSTVQDAPMTPAQRDGGECFVTSGDSSGWGCFGQILNSGWQMEY